MAKIVASTTTTGRVARAFQAPRAAPRGSEPRPAQLVLLDAALITLALIVATVVRTAPSLQPYWAAAGFSRIFLPAALVSVLGALVVFQVIAVPFVYYALGRYQAKPDESKLAGFAKDGMIVLLAQYPILAILYLLKSVPVPRGILVLDFALLAVLLPGWRAWWSGRERRRLVQGENLQNVLIVGAGETPQKLAADIVANPLHGMRLVGFLDERPLDLDKWPRDILARPDVWARRAGDGPIPVSVVPDAEMRAKLESRADLKAAVTTFVKTQPRHILATVGDTSDTSLDLALDGLCVEQVFLSADVGPEAADRIVRACRARGVDVHLVPTHYPGLGASLAPWKLGDFTLVSLYRNPIPRASWAMKRALDVVGGAFGLLVFSPVILASILAIKIENPRMPVFYRGLRVGHKGRHFRILKLATMVPDADAHREKLRALNARDGPWFQIDADKDPRITRVGRVLRKYTINELPQFWNVFVGDMSLVGPRPLATDEVSRFVEYDFRYYRTFDVKPGMTGLWQVKGRSDPSFEQRIAYDFEYIEKWSIWLDLYLLVATPLALVYSPGR